MEIETITIDEATKTIFFGGTRNGFMTKMVDRRILESNDPSLPPKVYDLDILRHQHHKATGFLLSYGGKSIDYFGDDIRDTYVFSPADIGIVRDTYVFTPADIGIVIQTKTSPIPPGGRGDPGETRQSEGVIFIKGVYFNWTGRITPHGYRLPDSLDILKKLLHTKAIKFMRRNLQSVAKIGENRGLPENVEGVIGKFLSGKHGHLVAQQNALKQSLGFSLAPQVRAPKLKTEGGKRTTRKNKRQI